MAAETVNFAIDGVTYEIDLNADHAATLRADLARWIGHARRTGGRRGAASAKAGERRNDLAQIRDWARANGHEVSSRGRISAKLQDAYDRAQG